MVRDRIDLLLRNGLQGIFLVFLMLALFLNLRLAFWVTLGIPVSFLAALLVLPEFDVSINMVSLFAFIMVLGIVVSVSGLILNFPIFGFGCYDGNVYQWGWTAVTARNSWGNHLLRDACAV